ncbi:MAG: hypothetical protein Cons2KO_16910 [Congregibacter sp.]
MQLPALRSSPPDILTWAKALLRAEASTADKADINYEAQALQVMQQHIWPGNLEELIDRIRDAVRRTTRDALSVLDLGLFQLQSLPPTRDDRSRPPGDIPPAS